jgi:hypothetical protein
MPARDSRRHRQQHSCGDLVLARELELALRDESLESDELLGETLLRSGLCSGSAEGRCAAWVCS